MLLISVGTCAAVLAGASHAAFATTCTNASWTCGFAVNGSDDSRRKNLQLPQCLCRRLFLVEKVLLNAQAKADPAAADEDGWTPAFDAAGHAGVLRLLQEAMGLPWHAGSHGLSDDEDFDGRKIDRR